jgi:hypothetical protein
LHPHEEFVRSDVFDWIAEACGALRVKRVEHVQTLWSGYGEIVRVALEGGIAPTAIVKHVRPPASRMSVGDARKRRSYDVELAFYREYAPRLDDDCRVARLYTQRVAKDEWWFVLEDLDASGFGLRSDRLYGADLDACLAWLARFHARFLGEEPRRLWPTGTYWHLATRIDELDAIRDPEVRASAAAIDARLRAAQYQTIVHGDAKEANFCFARDHRVAAVDFQYAGGGVGVRDVAYLLDGEEGKALDTYFRYLRGALGSKVNAGAVEAEWRALYPVAHQDFRRFLAGWNPVG